MRIALLSFEYPPETGFGGIGTYAYYQARALAKLGHDVHVFAGSQKDGRFHSGHEGVKVTRIKHGGWLNRWLAVARQKRAWWFHNRLETGFAAYKALRHELDQGGFDFVEAPECGGDAIVSTTLLPIPTAVRFHSPARLIMGVYDTPKMDRELCAFAEQIAINQAQVLTSCSRFLADEVAARMNVRTPIHVIPNGIDLQLFDRDEGIDVHSRFGIPRGQDQITVFFANRMEERKGIHIVRDMVFHCLQGYPHVTFVFAGRDLFGYMEKRILPWVKDHQLQSRFLYLGQLDLAAVRAVLKQIDIFLIPSLWENCPYSCLEAMAAGRAIVSSDCGGMPELITHERTGLLARNGDPAAFVAALSRMIEDPGLRSRCGDAARREVEARLTDVAIGRRTVEVYQAWLDKNPLPTDSAAERRQRHSAVAAAPAAPAAEVVELRARVSALENALDDQRRSQLKVEQELRAGREFRLGNYLLHDLKLGPASRRMKKWFRKARNLKNRGALRLAAGSRPRVVLASTWDFPSPTHTFVYQEMQSLIGAGFDARVFFWQAQKDDALVGRFDEILRRRVRLEPVHEIQAADRAHLERAYPGRLQTFLERVAAHSGRKLDELNHQPIVAHACTFARMVELFGARYLHSYFFYDQSFMALLAAQVLGIPRGISAYADHMLADWPFKLVPLHLETAELVVATSRRVRDELVQIGGSQVADKILVKPNGVDGTALRASARPATPGAAFELCSICRLEPKKGLLTLVEAVDLLVRQGRNLRVHVVGAEDPLAAGSVEFAGLFRQRIQERGLGERFVRHGFLPQARFLPILASAQAFVAPYVETPGGDKDGIPTAILEAMATGLPIVATAAGSIAEAVEHERQGLLVPQRDAAALAQAIARLMDDTPLRTRLGAAAAERFQQQFDVRVTEHAFHQRVRALVTAAAR